MDEIMTGFAGRRKGQRPMQLLQKLANRVMSFLPVILAALTVYCLVLAVMSFLAKHSVTVTAIVRSAGEVQRTRQRMPLAEMYAVREYAGLALWGMTYGIMQFLLAGFGCYLMVLRFQRQRGWKRMVRLYAILGMGCSLVYSCLFRILGTHKESLGGVTLKAVASPHFTVWLSVMLFGLVFLVARFSKGRRKR